MKVLSHEKLEVRPGVREESVSPSWLAMSTMNASDTANMCIKVINILDVG